jgi:hypothetical protein
MTITNDPIVYRYQRTDVPTSEMVAILVACRDQGGLVLRDWEGGSKTAWTTAECSRATPKNRRPEMRCNARTVLGMVKKGWLRAIDGEHIEITELGERAIKRGQGQQTEAA